MNIEEKIEYLRRALPALDRRTIYDVDNRGEEFCEIIYPNKLQPTMPIAVSISERGCLISVGQISDVVGSFPITPEQAVSAINDIISDKIVFVLGFADEDDIGFGAPFFTQIFPITGEEDDMSEELEAFVKKIEAPLSKWKRKLTRFKGRFVITNFSGSENRVIFR
ncbi:MAG: hypothetical protein IJD74_01125 [Clostridia bacterium]|nr:hypothetical protein [Clostridia bacterium]